MAEISTLDDALALWSAEPDERAGRPLLVLLHGYGADERDLFALVPYLPPEFVVAAVRAPLAPPWPAPGFSWYPIEGLDGRDPQAVTHAAGRLITWLGEAGRDAASLGLLGFSQGASVALQALRLEPELFDFVVNLSGYAAPGPLPGDAALAKLRPPVFWGRGTHDDVIPDFLVEHTTEWLPGHAELSGRVYPGLTHSVSEDELDDVRVFLEKRLEDAAGEAVPEGSTEAGQAE
ncbi:MAG TPA: alpha/beta hydrolase-fold protein [Microbacterium sp.]|uniref:alpha/beta hydrolase n=1 Tax=Microbacterium sp. TaxID=51671 RepID=UPI002C543CBB|nr:alpha/beta hydrolase-fold protein [Microbacterium sp.]HWI32603.1 alpha/beta hydrolase-fold protein [Microbacterium sp.]